MSNFFTRKRIIYGAIALVIAVGLVFLIVQKSSGNKDTLTQKVVKGDLQKTVLATGQVTSETDLDLSFKSPGLVSKINVKVGDEVEEGDILATLTQRDESARVTQARAGLASAKASYDKLIAGADTPEMNIAKAAASSAQTTYNNALASYNATKFQQDALVRNAQLTMFNSGLEAKRNKIVNDEVTAVVTGAYQGTEAGEYEFERVFEGSGYKLKYRGLETGTGTTNIKRGIPTPLGTKGLFVTFSTEGSFGESPVWHVQIPNPEASTYLTNLNSYNAALQARDVALLTAQNNLNTAESSLEQAKFNLAQTLAAARPEDVAVAQAQIMSAEGSLEAALAQFENTIIRAPASGTITSVEIAEGEQSPSGKAAIVLKDLNNLYVEANVAEANIAEIKPGQEVKVTFDSFGSGRVFVGKVAVVDPASTLVSGIVNYKVTAQIEKLPDIRPGMTANLAIVAYKKSNVLSVPERAVLDSSGKKIVRVVTNEKTKEYAERLVTTGIRGDGGMIEITSGLEVDQEIITDSKKK